ncbi:MAG: type IX secretion system membrane protein PorP/SprF, partial [Bacteroidia bacterium]|nr:type IX secretion system membrane protein PorP/SprF [Bacteroidia bacterium]
MKKLLLFITIITVSFITARSQQFPLYSQYMMNGFLLNPAIAGTVTYVPVCLTVRQQWAGIKDAPQTVALSSHTLLGRAEGVGGYVFND